MSTTKVASYTELVVRQWYSPTNSVLQPPDLVELSNYFFHLPFRHDRVHRRVHLSGLAVVRRNTLFVLFCFPFTSVLPSHRTYKITASRARDAKSNGHKKHMCKTHIGLNSRISENWWMYVRHSCMWGTGFSFTALPFYDNYIEGQSREANPVPHAVCVCGWDDAMIRWYDHTKPLWWWCDDVMYVVMRVRFLSAAKP